MWPCGRRRLASTASALSLDPPARTRAVEACPPRCSSCAAPARARVSVRAAAPVPHTQGTSHMSVRRCVGIVHYVRCVGIVHCVRSWAGLSSSLGAVARSTHPRLKSSCELDESKAKYQRAPSRSRSESSSDGGGAPAISNRPLPAVTDSQWQVCGASPISSAAGRSIIVRATSPGMLSSASQPTTCASPRMVHAGSAVHLLVQGVHGSEQ